MKASVPIRSNSQMLFVTLQESSNRRDGFRVSGSLTFPVNLFGKAA